MFYILCAIILSLVLESEFAKILAIYPTPSISHQVVFRPLMQELARRGHEVVVITTDPAFTKENTPANLTEIDIHDVSYNFGKHMVMPIVEYNHFEQIEMIIKVLSEIVEVQFKSTAVQKLLSDKSKTFDLLFVELCMPQALVFSHLYKVPTIQISSLGPIQESLAMTNALVHPDLYPYWNKKRLYNLTLLDRVWEIYSHYMLNKLCHKYENFQNKILKRIFGPATPELRKLKRHVQMIFLDTHPFWDLNRPVPQNIIYLGGMHRIMTQKLPKDLQLYLDNAIHGVIYMSLGTNVRTSWLPQNFVKTITTVFAQLPYNVLLKWDSDKLLNCPKNVKIGKWFPQSDLLKHPHIKLFITQGGLQSTDEAIDAGVPLVGIPLHSDQWFNVEQYKFFKIGTKLNIETVTEDEFRKTIEIIIKDPSYRFNIINLGKTMRDRMQTPVERGVFWTEYLLRHGQTSHLLSPAAHLHWTEYYELELVLVVIISFSLLLTAIIYIFCRLLTLFKKLLKSNYFTENS